MKQRQFKVGEEERAGGDEAVSLSALVAGDPGTGRFGMLRREAAGATRGQAHSVRGEWPAVVCM